MIITRSITPQYKIAKYMHAQQSFILSVGRSNNKLPASPTMLHGHHWLSHKHDIIVIANSNQPSVTDKQVNHYPA